LPSNILATGSTANRRPQLAKNNPKDSRAKTRRSVWPSKSGARSLPCSEETAAETEREWREHQGEGVCVYVQGRANGGA